MFPKLLVAIACLVLVSSQAGAQVRIAEFVARNNTGIVDADGANSDWIELENTSAGAVNLAGWSLTNQAAVPGLWTFPAVTLPAGGRLVVFASGKNRVNPAAELHTNFTLDGDGEYLALFQPGGAVVASQFAPAFPVQRDDFSYGVARNVTEDRVVTPTSAGKWLAPANSTLGTTWKESGFIDTAWTNVLAAVGFQSGLVGPFPQAYWTFDDTTADGAGTTPVTNNGAAFSAAVPTQIGGGKSLSFSSADGDFASSTINVSETTYSATFWFRTTNPNAGLWCVVDSDLGGGGHDRHVYLSNGNIASRVWNNETIASTGKAYANGLWHHVAHVFPGTSGSGQRIYVDGIPVASGVKAQSDFNWQQRVNIGFSNDAASAFLNGEIDDAAVWSVALTQSQVQTLAAGASPLSLAGVTPYVKTNVSSSMLNVRTTSYLRVPFTMPRPGTDYEQVALKVRYEDGFVAYINGTEVARRNAPASPVWNSQASSDRSLSAAVVVENIDIAAFKNLLAAGSNVLAVQVLNSTQFSQELLFSPEIIATDIEEVPDRYMAPTPALTNTNGYEGFVADTQFTVNRGWFTAPFVTAVNCATPGATLSYTTNGSVPTLTNGTLVPPVNGGVGPSVALNVSATTILRVGAFKPGFWPADTDTQTYIFTNLVRNQPSLPAGYPSTWSGGASADYAVDPNVVNTTLAGYSFEQAITALPTLSIVAPHDDLWGTNGIYYNTQLRGLSSERRVSIEYFQPDGIGKQWHADAGLRPHGNSSRDHNFTPKNPLRLYFRNEYGTGKLKEKVFEDSPLEEFNRLHLRAASTDSWPVVDGPPRWVNEKGTYIRDGYMRRSMLDAGNAAGHTRYVQLFLNGLYWGIYEITERPDEDFSAAYLGGSPDEYDVIKDFAELAAGNATAWNALMTLANDTSLTSDAGYWQVQGRNPDGSINPAIEPLLHIPSFIDYMILHIAGGAEDWPNHNYWTARRRGALSDGFHFFPWDQEISNDDVNRTASVIFPVPFELVNAANSPAILYDKLRQGAAFKDRFRERVHALFYNGGQLVQANSRARWAALQAQLDLPIVGESARWGDRQQLPAFKRETTWLAEMNFMQAAGTGFWDVMWPKQITRFRNVSLYPSINQPTISRPAGPAPPGTQVFLSSPVGVIYFTTDGTDPRGATGLPSATAQQYTGAPIVLNTTQTVRARVLSAGEWSGANFAFYNVNSAPASSANLVISELHYHPTPPTRAAELAASTDGDDYEFIELLNISAGHVDLIGVQFTEGVHFNFAASPILQLAPGGRVLVVKKRTAFEARHGLGLPIAGEFTDLTGLSNQGERILLIGTGGTIRDFDYDDIAPWPLAADGGGPSLLLINPVSNPNHALAGNWRASFDRGGTPGIDEAALTFDAWRVLFFDPAAPNYAASSAPLADPEFDGWCNFLEFALATNPLDMTRPLVEALTVTDSGVPYRALRYTRRPGAGSLSFSVEACTALTGWTAPATVLVSATPNIDGSTTETRRLATPISGAPSQFLRLKVQSP